MNDLQEALEQLDLYFNGNELSIHDLVANLKIVKQYDEDNFFVFINKLSPEILGEVAIESPESMLKDILSILPNEKISNSISELDSDDATDLIQYIEEIDEHKARELFDSLDKAEQEEFLRLDSYDENEAGAYMQTELFSGKLAEKLSDAISRLRRLKSEGELENISKLFVVDDFGILKYAIALEDLIMFDFNLSLQEIISQNDQDKYKIYSVLDTDIIQNVVNFIQEHDLNVVPVVDSKGMLIGRITNDDVFDIIQESATEQMYNLAGVDDEAEDDSLFKASKSRASWLFINLLTCILSSSIIGFFNDSISSLVTLAVLMPVVASMGGNAGTQALAVTVRRISLGEIQFKNAILVLKREISISCINGIVFGLFVGLVSWAWFAKPLLGLVFALSMLINLFFAGFWGTIIPLTLKKFNIDPAVGSSVVLTTFTDSIGFFIFLGLAKWILL